MLARSMGVKDWKVPEPRFASNGNIDGAVFRKLLRVDSDIIKKELIEFSSAIGKILEAMKEGTHFVDIIDTLMSFTSDYLGFKQIRMLDVS